MAESEKTQPTMDTVTIGNKELLISDVTDRVRRNANWFYWIAGFSVANSVTNVLIQGYGMFVMLGTTQIVHSLALIVIEEGESLRGAALFISLFFSILAASIYVLFGYHARKLRMWAYYVGIPLYFLDALIFVLVQDWFGVGFHAIGLVILFGGASGTRPGGNARLRLP